MYSSQLTHKYPAREPDPGQTPVYIPTDGATARTIVLNQFKVDYKRHHDENTMDAALIERLQSMLDPEHAQTLREAMVATPNPSFKATFTEAVRRWGRTTPSSRAANMISLTNAWHPSDGLQRLWNQINDAANYAVFAGSPIPESILVDSALICIAKTQAYKQAYLDFKHEQNQTLVHLKQFFDERDNNCR